jgi:hypothetical protein
MKKIVKSGGWVICIAEPDHKGRIDQPADLEAVGLLQTHALQKQGAEIQAGRKLSGWMVEAGIPIIETGLIGGQWIPQAHSQSNIEWEILGEDLSKTGLSAKKYQSMKDIDMKSRKTGSRILFVPTFYCLGKVQ